jgi:hypothetical protein
MIDWLEKERREEKMGTGCGNKNENKPLRE